VSVPKSLKAYRAELARMIEADEEGAEIYAAKAVELRSTAEVLRAEAAGIDKAIEAYRIATEDKLPLVPRVVNEDDPASAVRGRE